MMRFLFCFLLCCSTLLVAQTRYDVVHYDENDGLAQRYVTQIVQDHQGYIWIGTWNGLDRFDGYEFVNFKSTSDDGCDVPSDRIMNLRLSSDGNLWCLIDNRVFLFDTHTCRYRQVSSAVERKMLPCLRVVDEAPVSLPGVNVPDIRYCMTDKGGTRWYRSNYGVYKAVPYRLQYTMFPQQGESQVRFFYRDRKGRCWVTSKDDKTVRLYAQNGKLLGYLAPNGQIVRSHTSFISSIYCVFQDRKGNFWLGSKPNGLYRLVEGKNGFAVSNYLYEPHTSQLNNNSIYDIKEDVYGRLWLATFSAGLCCVEHPDRSMNFVTYKSGLSQYPKKGFHRVRNLLITHEGVLLAATTGGLLVANTHERSLEHMTFVSHTRDAGNRKSLSNNATMSLFQNRRGRVFVCTESGGFNEILSDNLLASHLQFKHYNLSTGFSTDVVLTLFEQGSSMWAVSNDKLIRINKNNHYTVFGNEFFHDNVRFSDAIPVRQPRGEYLFGLQTGALVMNLGKLRKSSFVPPIVITGCSKQNGPIVKGGGRGDTIVLAKNERSLTVYFSALDFAGTKNLQYAFSVDGKSWNYVNRTHSATFIDLAPGTYTLRIRSTNHDGVWVDNQRIVTILVTPTFWQTAWAKLLYLLLAALFLWGVVYTILYIHRINARNKTLKAYLALIEMKENKEEADERQMVRRETEFLEEAKIKAADDVFMRRVVTFVEQHLSDSDVSIDNMAEAAATSRAGLNRKMKTILGITPMDFLREVRIQKACQLLGDKNIPVTDIAVRCGFSDARYFSRIFKAKKGKTPTDYRNSCHQAG